MSLSVSILGCGVELLNSFSTGKPLFGTKLLGFSVGRG